MAEQAGICFCTCELKLLSIDMAINTKKSCTMRI